MSDPTPSPSGITIRFATYSELYAAAVVLGKAFFDDVLFGQYIHPHREKYPDDIALYFYRMWQSDFFDWAMVFLVAVERDDVTGKEAIVGVAQWHRNGDMAGQHGWGLGRWDVRNLLTPLSQHLSTLSSHLHPNRAIDPTKTHILEESDSFTSHLWHPPRRENWYLHFLGVDPAHHGKGIGRLLVRWGIEQARKEHVGASVIAAYKKDRFYRKCGFVEFIGWAGMGKGNPLGIIQGGNIWWVGPEGAKDEKKKEVKGGGGDGVVENGKV